MTELVMKAARELGIGDHVFVRELADRPDPLVMVTYPPKAVQGSIPIRYVMDERLDHVKTILSVMAKRAQK